MKRRNIVNVLFSFILVGIFSSCLKDKEYDKGRTGIKPDKNLKIAEIEGPQKGFYNVDLIATNSDTTLVDFVTVRLASDEPADKDIQVTFAVNPAIITEYNTNNATSYVVPASGLYTIPSLTVTIPKGERRGYLKLTTRASNLLGTEYALGVQLANVSDPGIKLSGNYNKQVIAFAIRNKYDGEYSMSVKTKGWGAYGIADDDVTRNWPRNIELATASANSIIINDPDGSGNLQPAFTSGGGTTAFGAATPKFTFDAADKLINVNNSTADDGRGRAFRLNTAVTDSRYDPVTKKIHAAYLMLQNGRPDQEIYITFTYVGTR